ncbi:hypothetical protein, partial [Anaerofustis stercorihominis]|uniref:hypothetical protein n=1 Tax=Anaerofustis stercorihominis TaxID=214853 RepID=UPI0034652D21
MLDRSFLDKIVEMSKANTFELGGYTYSDKNLTRIEEPPIYPLSFNTLQGICDVIKSEIDKYASPLVVIANYNSVTVYSTLKGNRDRDKIFISNAITPNTRFNDYIPLENFIISLKSDFCDSDDREKIIKMLSCVTDDSSVINSDDGISQKVEVIKGISLKDIKEIKERVSLTPYSCFN